MRFQMVDRIIHCTPSESISALKLTAREEVYWDGASGTMPPELVLEALCQAGAWLVVESTGGRRRAALLSLGGVEILGDVRPGDVLALRGEVRSMTDEVAILDGYASVGEDRKLAATQIMCVLVDAETLEDPADTERVRRMLRREVAA